MFKGLQERLGSFGHAIERAIAFVADPIRTLFGLAQQAEISVDVPILRQELSYIRREGEVAPHLAVLGRNEEIPENLYVESNIHYKQPFAYEVTIFGRNLETGLWERTARIVTSSKPLTAADAMEIVGDRFSADGDTPQMLIEELSLTGAFTRAGEIPF